jgi:cysteine synthase
VTQAAPALAPGVDPLVKRAGLNPGGWVKDDSALSSVQDALRASVLIPGKVLPDSTTGNTSIARTMLGAAMGFALELVLPANVNGERLLILRACGAQLTVTDPALGTNDARRVADEVAISRHLRGTSTPTSPLTRQPADPLPHHGTRVLATD